MGAGKDPPGANGRYPLRSASISRGSALSGHPCPSSPRSRSRARGSHHCWWGGVSARPHHAPSYFFLTPPGAAAPRAGGPHGRRARRGAASTWWRGSTTARACVLHLGMTGQLFAAGAASPRLLSAAARASLAPEEQRALPPDAHTHLRLAFADGGPEVFFRDVRKFGKVLLAARGEGHPRLERLGVDALARQRRAALRGHARAARRDQERCCSTRSCSPASGNIYADEALFLRGRAPDARAPAR